MHFPRPAKPLGSSFGRTALMFNAVPTPEHTLSCPVSATTHALVSSRSLAQTQMDFQGLLNAFGPGFSNFFPGGPKQDALDECLIALTVGRQHALTLGKQALGGVQRPAGHGQPIYSSVSFSSAQNCETNDSHSAVVDLSSTSALPLPLPLPLAVLLLLLLLLPTLLLLHLHEMTGIFGRFCWGALTNQPEKLEYFIEDKLPCPRRRCGIFANLTSSRVLTGLAVVISADEKRMLPSFGKLRCGFPSQQPGHPTPTWSAPRPQ